MMKLPYGISNFKKIVDQNYHIIDKTKYIEILENRDESYIFLLRPRRFGKSLFVSMLHHYYAKEYKDDFDCLFGKYYIGKNPTELANTYNVLNFDFSGIDTTESKNTFSGFLKNIKVGVANFIDNYPEISDEKKKEILSENAPNTMMKLFFSAYKKANIFIIIDEYDHFANELMAFDFKRFSTFVSENGFVRKFYEVIKEATKFCVDRIFVTGVTPITLDSMTSGFNIGKDLSLKSVFNEMFGFTSYEVKTLVSAFLDNKTAGQIDDIMIKLKKLYNGYLFSQHTDNRIYNPDMVLYFLHEYREYNSFPQSIIDTNIASDYGKIQNLFALYDPFKNTKILEKLMETGNTKASITEKYSFEREFTSSDFVSLMYYLGLVTIHSVELKRLIFCFPNYVIEELYREFFINHVRRNTKLDIETDSIEYAMLQLAQQNQITPFIKLIEKALYSLSNQDFKKFDEKYIKALFVGFASLSKLYIIKSELEVEKKYPDVMFLYRPPIEPNYQFIFELKYQSKASKKSAKTTAKSAKEQLIQYLKIDEIKNLKNLKAYVLVFVGDKAEIVIEVYGK